MLSLAIVAEPLYDCTAGCWSAVGKGLLWHKQGNVVVLAGAHTSIELLAAVAPSILSTLSYSDALLLFLSLLPWVLRCAGAMLRQGLLNNGQGLRGGVACRPQGIIAAALGNVCQRGARRWL